MVDRTYTRRRALQIGGAGLVGSLAGCGGLTGESNDSGSAEHLDAVPSGATFLAHTDVKTLQSSQMVETAVDDYLSLASERQDGWDGPNSYDGALSSVQDALDLDPAGLHSVTTFWKQLTPGELPGVIAGTDYAEADVVDRLESLGEVSEQSYEGKTVYVDRGDTAVGVLGDGVYVLGNLDLVKSVVDVTNGDADSVGGDVVAAYDRAPDGPIRIGADVAEMDVTYSEESGLSGMDTFSAGMGIDGDQRRMVFEVETGDTGQAERLETTFDDGLSTYLARVRDSDLELFEDAVSQLETIDIERNGTSVSVTYSGTAEDAAAVTKMILAFLGVFTVGVSSTGTASNSRESLPQASFDFDYDAGASGPDSYGMSADGEEKGILMITHSGGDTLAAENISLTGGLAGRVGWNDAETGQDDSISAGDTVEYAVDSASTVSLIRESDGVSARLATWSGPDA